MFTCKVSLGWFNLPTDLYVLMPAHILSMLLHTLLFSCVHVNMKWRFSLYLSIITILPVVVLSICFSNPPFT